MTPIFPKGPVPPIQHYRSPNGSTPIWDSLIIRLYTAQTIQKTVNLAVLTPSYQHQIPYTVPFAG